MWLLAAELRDACELAERGEVHYAARPPLGVPESIAAYDRNAADLEACVARLDDAAWDRKARFMLSVSRLVTPRERHDECTAESGGNDG